MTIILHCWHMWQTHKANRPVSINDTNDSSDTGFALKCLNWLAMTMTDGMTSMLISVKRHTFVNSQLAKKYITSFHLIICSYDYNMHPEGLLSDNLCLLFY